MEILENLPLVLLQEAFIGSIWLKNTSLITIRYNRESKVNSEQEACAKCFPVHILKFEILQITWKKWNKEHQTLGFQFFTNTASRLMFLFFRVVCKILYFNMWTAKHSAQASCAEFALLYYGTIHLRRRHVLGGEGSKIGQICRRIVVKNCRRRGVGVKNRENLPTS